ncbi:MAG: beta-ketoacyl-ACP synthase II [Chloroflexi bacterium]|nr:beta-ketoacyl-ACP synthase II [Chloroflexota bacterium]
MPNPSSQTRVVVTGLGALTPLGNSVDEFWAGLKAGKSGIAPLTLVDTTDYPTKIGGEVRGYDPTAYVDRKEARRMARFSQLAVGAAAQALADSRLDMSAEQRDRVGVLLGTGIGGLPETEEQGRIMVAKGGMRMSPFFIPMILPNMATANVSRVFGATGFSNTTITACAAGTQAIGEAREAILRRRADVMIAGGAEAGICQLGLGGFCTIQALTRRNDDPEHASRPFDAKRDGFAPAEGAGIVILESEEHARARGARIYGELAGYGASSDAFHLVQPPEDGAGAARAMKWALEDAGLQPGDVSYINAHGTSTPLNDAAETRAIKLAFGEQARGVPISSTKSMIGHSLGASGGLEAVVSLKTIGEGVIHPTANYEVPDPQCDLDYVPGSARKADVRYVLSNSFGFGGQNACLVFARYEP